MLLLQLLGVHVQLEAAFLHSLHDHRPGLFADVRMIVQNTGDGGNRIAGFGGQVFDGHSFTFIIKKAGHAEACPAKNI